MGCTITITSIQGFNVPGQQVPSTIRVNGTATSCDYVVVGLECHQPPEEVVVPVDPTGNWSADFVASQVNGCRCMGDTLAYAFCKADPSCRVERGVPSLQCQQVGECPVVTGLMATVNGCAGSGNAAGVTFTGTLSPPSTCTFQWNFGDNSPPVTTNTPSTTHLYSQPGTYAVTVAAICGTCIQQTSIFVTVPVCCPTLTGVAFNVNGCADGQGTSATVTCIATTNPGNAQGTFTWDFGDGSPPVTTPTPSITHSYSNPGSYAVQVSLTPTDTECPPTTTGATVTVPQCPPNTGGGGDGGEGVGCKALRYIMIIAAILAALALLISICVPAAATVMYWIAGVLGAMALLAGIIWAIFCPKPCGYGLLFAWQVGLGVGFAALYFTQCCPWLWWVGIGLIVAALATLALWVKKCKRTYCQTIVEVSIAITGALLPILGWLGVIPALQACINSTVAAVLSTLAAAIAVAMASCVNNNQSP